MTEAAGGPALSSLSFEQALEELEGLVRQLETGRVRLDDAIGAYERGAALKRHCEAKLNEAKAKVEKIAFAADGSITTEAANLDQ
jgi:exodeoxyribonuclease VII small subunit